MGLPGRVERHKRTHTESGETQTHTHARTHTHTRTRKPETSDLPVAEAMLANSYVRYSNLCWDCTIQQLARLMNCPPLILPLNSIVSGSHIPLQRPGKSRGPVAHLRPAVLLTALRKILSLIVLRRINKDFNNFVAPTHRVVSAPAEAPQKLCGHTDGWRLDANAIAVRWVS